MISSAPALHQVAHDIFGHALNQCSIEQAFARNLKTVRGESGSELLLLGDEVINLDRIKRIRIVAAGKASTAMLESLLPHLPTRADCDLAGVLIAKDEPPRLPPGFRFFPGGHPVPNEASIEGARAALSLVRSLQEGKSQFEDALCLFLISGGASAMMELPLDPTISLVDVVGFYRELVHSGASIAEINCIRKHFSAVKGGRLAMAAGDALSFSLLVSDVPSGHLDALASGPTLADTSTVAQCREILTRHKLLERFPPSVQRFFASPELRETYKPGELSARALTLLAPEGLADSAKKRAEDLGFYAVIDNTCDDWDYRAAAEYLLDRLRSLSLEDPRVCIISSGEITVELPGEAAGSDGNPAGPTRGIGGRNQHFALYAATLLDAMSASVVIFSAGSDGIDGNSSAAGAVVDRQTLLGGNSARGSHGSSAVDSLLADAQNALRRFDSGRFLESVGATVTTGATGNNLRDLRILLAERPS